MKRLLTILLFTLCLPLSIPADADEIEIIDLQSRPASELIPILRPMLKPGGAISGTGFQLIIRTSPENLEQLQTAIAKLDQSSKQLLITVRQGGDDRHLKNEGSISGRYEGGSGNISIGSETPGIERGATLGSRGEKGHITARVYSTDRQNREALSQSVRTQDGEWATIYAGQSVPYPTQSIVQTPYGASVQQGIEYKDVTSGFEVRPRVNGEQVILEVRPFYNKLSRKGAGIIDTQSASTTVSGRLGEWMEIAGTGHQEQRRGRGMTYSTRRKDQGTRRIFLKVELLP